MKEKNKFNKLNKEYEQLLKDHENNIKEKDKLCEQLNKSMKKKIFI